MFETGIDGVVFGLIATFFVGVITSIVAKFNLDNYAKSNNNTNA